LGSNADAEAQTQACNCLQVAELRRGIAETLQTCFMLTRLEGLDMRELVMGATLEECAARLPVSLAWSNVTLQQLMACALGLVADLNAGR
jgi:hypothetical protein